MTSRRESARRRPLVLDTPDGRLSFISTTTVFGTPVDVTCRSSHSRRSFPPMRRRPTACSALPALPARAR
jgi:hypothetical protein